MNKESKNIFYTTPIGQVNARVQNEDDKFWLTQKRIAELFGVESNTVSNHLKEINKSGELQEDRTCKDFLQVQMEGDRSFRRNIPNYNLDMIIVVGYRMKSQVVTRFRQWVSMSFSIKGSQSMMNITRK